MLNQQDILLEYAKCLSDPKYVIETYLETFDKTKNNEAGAYVPFKLFPRQSEIVDAYERFKHNIITKPRQAGVSTTTAAYLTVKAAFADPQSPESILIIANKQDLAINFLSKIKEFLGQIPRWTWGADYYGNTKNEEKTIFIKDSEKEIKLPNGSRIKAVATSKDALRGFTPTYLVMDEAAYIENGNEVFTAAQTSLGTGGRSMLISCVTKDTYVFTSEGIKQIEEFINPEQSNTEMNGYVVPEYTIRGYEKERSSHIFVNNGLQKTIKLRSTSAELEGTETHKLWAYSNKNDKFDWYKMSELTVGDYINIQSGFELWGNDDSINLKYEFNNKEHKPKKIYKKIDTDLAYLIGLYISEGSCYKHKSKQNVIVGCTITITCGDDISNAIKNAGFNYSSHDKLHYAISSKYLGALLEYLGFDLTKKAKQKEIPSRLFRMSRKNIIAMIQGIMDGDGYSDATEGKIGIGLSSEKLVKQMRMLFLNFGILTDYQTGITRPTERVKVESPYYRICAVSSNAKRYYDLIGFRFKRKQDKAIALPNISRGTQTEFIPNGKKILREIIDDNKLIRKLTYTGLKVKKLSNKKHKTFDINKETFILFIEYFNNILKLDLSKYNIDKILLTNGKWQKIKEISSSENETYDFSLPNINNDNWCHSIIYNGVLGHQTPNGLDELYYKTYQQAKAKKNNFNVIEMKWYEDLRYNRGLKWIKKLDDNKTEEIVEYEFTFESYEKKLKEGFKPWSPWYDGMCRNMNNDARMIAQELDVSFIGSAGNVIDEKFIEFQEKNNVREPLYTKGSDNEIWVWEEPIVGHKYILNGDVARGDGKDFSTIEILDFTTMEQVMEYQGKVPPDLLAYIVKEWSDRYNAYVVIDITGGMGIGTIRKLIELGCTRLHYDKAHNPALMEFARENGETPGFTINSVRTPMIAHLEHCVRENMIKIRSQRLTNEMKTFVFKDKRADHMTGYHDDLLMALAMGLWVLEHSFKNLERVNEQTKAMLNAFIGYDPLKGKPTDQPKVANPFLKQTKQNRIGGSNILWIPPR